MVFNGTHASRLPSYWSVAKKSKSKCMGHHQPILVGEGICFHWSMICKEGVHWGWTSLGNKIHEEIVV